MMRCKTEIITFILLSVLSDDSISDRILLQNPKTKTQLAVRSTAPDHHRTVLDSLGVDEVKEEKITNIPAHTIDIDSVFAVLSFH